MYEKECLFCQVNNVELTNDVIKTGMVAAGEKVGEKVDHHQALLLSLRNKSP